MSTEKGAIVEVYCAACRKSLGNGKKEEGRHERVVGPCFRSLGSRVRYDLRVAGSGLKVGQSPMLGPLGIVLNITIGSPGGISDRVDCNGSDKQNVTQQ